jgi:hypothetical protein
MDETLASEIEGLRKLKTKALRARFEELFGEESRSSNHAHLFRRIAWRLQANAEDAALRLRAPRRFWHADGSVGLEPAPRHRRDPRLPPVGTVLKRVYREQAIEVTVLATAFEYQGKQYGSLSLIAQRVTGTRWNGYHFFGLKKNGIV